MFDIDGRGRIVYFNQKLQQNCTTFRYCPNLFEEKDSFSMSQSDEIEHP